MAVSPLSAATFIVYGSGLQAYNGTSEIILFDFRVILQFTSSGLNSTSYEAKNGDPVTDHGLLYTIYSMYRAYRSHFTDLCWRVAVVGYRSNPRRDRVAGDRLVKTPSSASTVRRAPAEPCGRRASTISSDAAIYTSRPTTSTS